MRFFVWIALAAWPSDLPAAFDATVRSLFEANCLACHRAGNALGGLSIETRESALLGGEEGPSIVPGDAEASPLWTRLIVPAGESGAMPPAGARLTEAEVEAVREWIEGGAPWEGSLRAALAAPQAASEELALAGRIRRRIEAKAADSPAAPFEAYDQPVPETDAVLRMMPLPGGEFLMGTPEDEAGRNDDEGPQRTVRVDAFWMSAHEVTWDAFRHFMLREAEVLRDPDKLAAAVSSPTPPYVEMSFGMGINGYPAISMTQHAASMYAQWLSAKTGRFYRLPTEAEWEYACRAGSVTPYSFGDSPSQLAEHGWFWENSDAQYRPVGTKKPNAFGLYDMHGNVWEWTLDRYEDRYPAPSGPIGNPWAVADRLYPRAARGGSWMDDAPALRCGARKASSEDWKMQDPQLPKSIWYHTDAPWLGFRLIRPVELPSSERMHAYWSSAAGKK